MITGPKGAKPTTRGWVSSKGELLKSQRISPAQIAEWEAARAPKPAAVHQPEPAVQTLHEAPVEEEKPVSQSTYTFFSRGDVE